MIRVDKRLRPPGSPWAGRLGLALFGVLLVIPVVAAEALVGWLVVRGHLPGAAALEAWAAAHPSLAAGAVVVLHGLVVLGGMRLMTKGLSVRLLRWAVARVRGVRLGRALARIRKRTYAYLEKDEAAEWAVEVDPRGRGVPGRALTLLLGLLLAALLLDLWVLLLLRGAGAPVELMARGAAARTAALATACLLLADLDDLRARVLVGMQVVGLVALTALAPSLLAWGPGIVPAMALLLAVLVVRATGGIRHVTCLLLTDRGVRLLTVRGEVIELERDEAMRPQRLILSPGAGESRWQFLESGKPPLEVQPLGGNPQEVGVTGGLHGYPVRITGERGGGALSRELASQGLPLGAVGALLVASAGWHWIPALAGLLTG